MRSLALLVLLLAAGGCSGGGKLGEIDRIFLVTFDTTRADHVGAYGSDRGATPVLDALAADGALFEQVVSPAPTTMPSHSTMMTGLYPPDHGVRYNLFYKLADRNVTLAETFGKAGFATAAFPATHIVSERFGLDQGFDHWVEPPERPDRDPDSEHPVSRMRSAEQGVDDAIAWLTETENSKTFAWLHFYDPHWPYDPPFPYSDTFRDSPYYGEIAYTDRQLGRLIEHLKADGSWDRTLLIVTGDHGEGRYDHREPYHSVLVYESTQRVPLIVHGPGVAPRRIAEPVTLADIAPTALDAVGLAMEHPIRGISLVGALTGAKLPTRELYFESLAGAIAYGWLELTGVRVGEWKLIDSNDPELFDLEEDPGELANQAIDRASVVATMREGLQELAAPIAEVSAEDATYSSEDEEEMARLAGLGYVEGSLSRSSGVDVPHPKDLIVLHEEILMAQSAAGRGDWSTVERVARYVLEQDPTNKWGLTSAASSAMQQGRVEEALAPAERLVELSPSSDDSAVVLVNVLRGLGRAEEAHAALEAQIDACAAEESCRESERIRYLTIVSALELGRPGICEAMVPEAVESFDESSRIRLMQARCEAFAGRREATLDELQKAWDLGFRRFDLLEQADEFDAVRDDPRYRDFVARAEAEAEAEGEDAASE